MLLLLRAKYKKNLGIIVIFILFIDFLVVTSCSGGHGSNIKDVEADPGYILWIGMSQKGKSSSIKLLTGDKSIKCGNYGQGVATTKEINIYKDINGRLSKPYYHIDTIGMGDNRLLYNDQQIRNHVETQILKLSYEKNVNFIDAIVITQSFPGDELSLIPIFKQIENIFGFFPRNSIIVVGTKINQCPKNKIPIRRKKIIETMTMKQFNIPSDRYMDFLTPCTKCDPKIKKADIPRRQFKKFSVLIDGCQKVQLQSINQKRQKIKKRALQILKQKTIVSQIDDIRQQIKTKQVYKIKPMYQKKLFKRRSPFFGERQFEEFVRTDIQILDSTKTIEVQVPYKKTVNQIPPSDYCYRLALEQFQKENLKQMWRKKQQ